MLELRVVRKKKAAPVFDGSGQTIKTNVYPDGGTRVETYYQDGSLQFEVKLTGVISNGAAAPGEDPKWGELVAPQVCFSKR